MPLSKNAETALEWLKKGARFEIYYNDGYANLYRGPDFVERVSRIEEKTFLELEERNLIEWKIGEGGPHFKVYRLHRHYETGNYE